MAADFHKAWLAAKTGDLFELATLAPTAIVFGAWDSRSSQAKLQRLIKAHIRATNVLERTRSAQYTPAADYVALGAIDASVNVGEDDKNNLSQEGMKHALSTQTVGGVALTATSKLTRTVNVNLAAVRQLRAAGVKQVLSEKATEDEKNKARAKEIESSVERTQRLQEYILGLILVAAYSQPNLNLREGCNLQTKKCGTASKLIQDGRKNANAIDSSKVEGFAVAASKAFFTAANADFDKKDKHGKFESGIAEQFLAMPTADRDRVRVLGPITANTMKNFAEQGKDPFKLVADAIKATKEAIGKVPGKKEPRAKKLDELKPLADALKAMSENASLDDRARKLAGELSTKAMEHHDSHAALKDIETRVKEFKKAAQANASAESTQEAPQ